MLIVIFGIFHFRSLGLSANLLTISGAVCAVVTRTIVAGCLSSARNWFCSKHEKPADLPRLICHSSSPAAPLSLEASAVPVASVTLPRVAHTATVAAAAAESVTHGRQVFSKVWHTVVLCIASFRRCFSKGWGLDRVAWRPPDVH